MFLRCESLTDVAIGDFATYRPIPVKDATVLSHIPVTKSVLAVDVCRLSGLSFAPISWLVPSPKERTVINVATPLASTDAVPPMLTLQLNAPTAPGSLITGEQHAKSKARRGRSHAGDSVDVSSLVDAPPLLQRQVTVSNRFASMDSLSIYESLYNSVLVDGELPDDKGGGERSKELRSSVMLTGKDARGSPADLLAQVRISPTRLAGDLARIKKAAATSRRKQQLTRKVRSPSPAARE